jgi:hypothetical protein
LQARQQIEQDHRIDPARERAAQAAVCADTCRLEDGRNLLERGGTQAARSLKRP